jgi:hypothetical protein
MGAFENALWYRHYARMLIVGLCRDSYEHAQSQFPHIAPSVANSMHLTWHFLGFIRGVALHHASHAPLAIDSPLASAPPPFPDTGSVFSWTLSFHNAQFDHFLCSTWQPLFVCMHRVARGLYFFPICVVRCLFPCSIFVLFLCFIFVLKSLCLLT